MSKVRVIGQGQGQRGRSVLDPRSNTVCFPLGTALSTAVNACMSSQGLRMPSPFPECPTTSMPVTILPCYASHFRLE